MRIAIVLILGVLAPSWASKTAVDVKSKKSKRGVLLGAPGVLHPAAHSDLPWPAGPTLFHTHQPPNLLVPVAPTYTRVGVPGTFPVPVDRHVAVPVKVPFAIPVDRPFPVHVPVVKHVPVPVIMHLAVDRPVPVHVPVDRPVPVHVPVDRPVPVHVPVDRPIPVPVPVPQPYPVIINRGIPSSPVIPASSIPLPSSFTPNVNNLTPTFGQIPPPPAPTNPSLPAPSASLQAQQGFQHLRLGHNEQGSFHQNSHRSVQNHFSLQHQDAIESLAYKNQQSAFYRHAANNVNQEVDVFAQSNSQEEEHGVPTSYYRGPPPPPPKLRLVHRHKSYHPSRITIRAKEW